MMNEIVDGISGPRIGLHICRGNWSTREDVLLSGDYAPLLPALTAMNIDQFVLEYATPRAGDIAVVGQALNSKELGLGVVNPRTITAESPEEIVERAEKALAFYRPDQLWLNTDCGFGCFAHRCVNVESVAAAKTTNIVRAARILRERHG
jgi:5-methyltetrahydropteroyltriglutamate--homocysteine methyltransferase